MDDFEFGEYGFPDDGYDYSKHFIAPTEGMFFPAPTKEKKNPKDKLKEATVTKMLGVKDAEEIVELDFYDPNAEDDNRIAKKDLEEIDRLFDAEDVENDLQDNFVQIAMGGEGSEEELEEEVEEMEFDEEIPEHILRMMKERRSEKVYSEEEEHVGDERDMDEMEREFDKLMDEYEDGNSAKLDDIDVEENGGRHLGASGVQRVLNEYLEQENLEVITKKIEESEKEDEKYRNEQAKLIWEQIENEVIKDEETVEYEVIKEKVEDKFDIESILSTYKNTANHPSIIKDAEDKNAPSKLEFSKKTKTVQKEPEKVAKKEAASEKSKKDLGKGRPKEESAEEKKERKKAVKEMKKKNRERKKELKLAYKEEVKKESKSLAKNVFANRTLIPL